MGPVSRAFTALSILVAAPAEGRGLERWQSLITEASARFGVPEDWIRRVMTAESGGRTMFGGRPITSSAGAMGLMQLMPKTWAEMRSAHGLGADPHDPRDNILAGTAYLRAMYDRFGYPGLFAAYNAGPGRYSKYLGGRRLPAETIAYVQRTAGAYAPMPGSAIPEASPTTVAGPARLATKEPQTSIFAIERKGSLSIHATLPAARLVRAGLFVPITKAGRDKKGIAVGRGGGQE